MRVAPFDQAVGDQAKHQPRVENTVATEHAPGLAGSKGIEQVDDVGRKIRNYQVDRGLIFDDGTVGNQESSDSLVNYFPLLVGFAPVDFLGGFDIQIIAAIGLVELH